ncbi:Hypothetical_protein [Hexamita inflata]|uniref:Hypothetical_protein n=1 Tax=Hexamita inflata TaxID=28002 RepID=A0AA86TSB3_9EUKA|nr:Hypothetical protein HINF_LOCUS14190 [Hexamita inflata]
MQWDRHFQLIVECASNSTAASAAAKYFVNERTVDRVFDQFREYCQKYLERIQFYDGEDKEIDEFVGARVKYHRGEPTKGTTKCQYESLFLTIVFQYIIELFTITIYDFININKFHKTTSIKYQNMNQVPNQIIMSTQMIAGLNEQYQQIQMFMDTNLDHPQVLFHDQLRQKYIHQTQMIDSKAKH